MCIVLAFSLIPGDDFGIDTRAHDSNDLLIGNSFHFNSLVGHRGFGSFAWHPVSVVLNSFSNSVKVSCEYSGRLVTIAWLPMVYGVVKLISVFYNKIDRGTFVREELNNLNYEFSVIHFYNELS